MVKTSLARYLKQSDMAARDYVEVKDSASVVQYGKTFLSQPGEKSGMAERFFDDIKQETFLTQKEESPTKIKTLAGISQKFQYFCEVRKCTI